MARERRRFEIDDKMEDVYTGSGGRQSLSMPSGLQLFKPPKVGTFRIEVVPFQVSAAVQRFAPGLRFARPTTWHWCVIYNTHGGIGPDNGTVVCPAKTYGKACPICEQRAKLNMSAHRDDKAAAASLKPKERQLLLVAMRDATTGSLGQLHLWEVSTYNFKKQLDLFLAAADPEDHETYARFWHPDRGMTLKVTGSEEKTGDGGGTYSKYSVMEMKARRDPLPDEIFDHGYDLHVMVREQSYATLRSQFHGADVEPDVPDADDAPPSRQSSLTDFDADAGRRVIDDGTSHEELPEPIPSAPSRPASTQLPKLRVGSIVSFERAGSIVTGEVTHVDEERQVVQVPIASRERPLTLDFEEVTLLTSESKPAAKSSPPAETKARVAPPPPADDDDDLPPAPKKRVVGR